MPLSNWPPGVGQHVRPVPQLIPSGVTAQEDLADGVVPGHSVVVPNGDHQVDSLWTKRATFQMFKRRR